jgi:hypothetical protein
MNPFKEKTTSFHDWNVLKDLNWHCSKCELKSGQAKTWQVWRQNGIQLDVDEKGNFFKKIHCKTCNNKTIHRKLKSLIILEETNIRSGLSTKFAKRVKEIHQNQEAVFLRKMPPKELEVDHKFPQIRWNRNESKNDNLSDSEVKDKFILLTRSNNLLKSRFCENCVKNQKRGYFPGIYFWYKGNCNWTADMNDERGCIGCFWYDPFKWRDELNNHIKSVELKN